MSVLARLLVAVVRLYQKAVSPLFPAHCRFHPTCSEYALQAVQEHGALRGAGFAVRRIGRCHPWNEGGIDPVPPRRMTVSPQERVL